MQAQKELADYYSIEEIINMIKTNKRKFISIIKSKNWTTKCNDMLKIIVDDENNTIAHYLAKYNLNWFTKDKDILMLKNNINETVAHVLAYNGKLITNDYNILIMRNNYTKTVAHVLAVKNAKWLTFDIKILELKHGWNNTVADLLALYNPRWCYYNKNFKYFNLLYEALIEENKYIASRVHKNAITIIPII